MASKTLSELALGTWDSGTSYTIGDIVDNGGSSYVCIANSTNNEPPNTTYWALLASKGDTGATGSTGATGATGPMGPSGAVGVTGTPVDNQLAVWTSATEVEGDSALTFDTTDDTLSTGILNATSLTASEIVGTNADKDLVSLAVATYPSLTELTYVKGVTSAIQTQLGDKAPLASPSFTGTVTTAGNIELGHATDTTLSRSAAGVLAVEGVNVLTVAGGTLTGNLTLGENTSVDLDPALSADGKYSGTCITGTAGAALSFGDLVYLSATDSRWELADADAATTADRLLGMVVLAAAGDGSATKILLQGNIRADAAFPTLTTGSPVYVGETAGDIQVAIPTGADNVIRRVGFAITADALYFNPSMDAQTTVA